LTKKGATPQGLDISEKDRVRTIVTEGPLASNLIFNTRGAISAKSVGISSGSRNGPSRFKSFGARKCSAKVAAGLKKRLIIIGQIQTGDRGRTKKKEDFILEIKQAKNEVMM
jgi:hypothetical protein